MPVGGPYASALVPEDLDELYSQTLKEVGPIAVPKALKQLHPCIAAVLKKDQRIADEASPHRLFTRLPVYSSPFEKRRFRILNTLFLKSARVGISFSTRGHEDLEIHARVGEVRFDVELDAAAEAANRSRYGGAPANLPASTPLKFGIKQGRDLSSRKTTWTEKTDFSLEDQLPEVIAGMIVYAEERLREWETEIHHYHIAEQKRRAEERLALARKREQERLTLLELSAQKWRQANDIRALVEAVMAASSKERYAAASHQLSAWREWALSHADRIDPVLSGEMYDMVDEDDAAS